jgi:hypothetical protein
MSMLSKKRKTNLEGVNNTFVLALFSNILGI